jgi:hypothetical protein
VNLPLQAQITEAAGLFQLFQNPMLLFLLCFTINPRGATFITFAAN